MHCPVCKNIALVMSDRHGIEIDYCPQCRGVWLDRGELDKIIDRTATLIPSQQGAPNQSFSSSSKPYGHSDHSGRYPQPTGQYKKKREGFFSDLFDFD